jgi:ribonucleoside-diphosphate reductase alpha chain
MKNAKIAQDDVRAPKMALPTELVEPKFSANSLEIISKRHLLHDKAGKIIETPKEMLWRVASAIASEDTKYVKGTAERKTRASEKSAREFYTVMAENRFFPGSRVLFEAGNEIDGTGQLSSCFVLPLEDDLQSIFQTMQEAAIVQKNNGGTGFNFSHIRPKGDEVGGTPNVAAGPVHFIKTFSTAFDQILQGKKRGGGNMAILNINHPDIIEFINLKGTDSSIRNFNISVGITNAFMEAVRNDEEYDLINPRTEKAVGKLRAREVFELICQKGWECADPGIFFLDTAQDANPTKPLGIIEATNPCGEEPLRSYESCNLGSVVLPSHLKKKGDKYLIDWDLLANTVEKGTHFLDNMIDLSKFPLEKIAHQVHQTRKLGLGVMGWGILLYKLGIPYNSDEAVELAKKIFKFIQEESTKTSEDLAKERGVFPAFKGSKWEKMGRRVRNATMSSIAPTGTISLVADTSSGIEPIFSLVYKRASFYQDEGKENRKKLLYVNQEFEQLAKDNGFYSEEVMSEIADNSGSLHGIDAIPADAKKIFVTTHDIEPEWHVKMQAAFQDSVDAAVSKTINLPRHATVDDIRKAYVMAWELGCKGITIYRDGSKENQVLESGSSNAATEKPSTISTTHSNVNLDITMPLTPNAVEVLSKRALHKDSNGNTTETPEQLWRRIADYIASCEDVSVRSSIAEKFFQLMNSGLFFSGGTLLWAGMGKDTILSKCLVLPVNDSIDSIFQTLEWNIQCLRRGVGTGFNFSKIRSSYSIVGTTGENAAGPVTYLKMYDKAQDTIRGRGGRGLGSMAILNVEHPNIEEFITAKDDLTSLSHYNISIGASDAFMQAVKSDANWDLVDPHDGKTYKTLKARELFENIAKHAWVSGDPGMYFLNTAEKGNTTPELGTMDATNPCGEQPLIPFETCNMGHINLSNIVIGFPLISVAEIAKLPLNDKLQFIDWDKLTEVTKLAVRFLDNIIDVNNYPIPEIEEMTKKTRNIGVGVMGFADMLIKLGISYGSEDSIKLIDKVMEFITDESHKASEELGEEKGSFPAFKQSIWHKQGINFKRNTRVTTIAPTGTISIIANCNPGIEPVFALGYRRKNSMGGTDQEVIDPLIKEVAKTFNFYSEEFSKRIADGAHLNDLAQEYSIPQYIVEVFKTTHEINPEDHVRIQAAFQRHIDSAVSKTINLPNSATWQDIARVYMLAFDLGCKGITVFRDGSKDPALQVGTKSTTSVTPADTQDWKAKYEELEATYTKQIAQQSQNYSAQRNVLEPRKREHVTKGYTYEVKTEQGDLYITVNEDDKGIVEIFLNLGKSGSFTAGYTEALGRLISMSLRSGIKPEAIVKQLQGIRTSTPTLNRGMIVYSVPDAIAKILKKHLDEMEKQIELLPGVATEPTPEPIKKPEPILVNTNVQTTFVEETKPVYYTAPTPMPTLTVAPTAPAKPVKQEKSKYSKNNEFGSLLECPDCGGDLEYSEGCILCRACGYSKCG